MSGHVEEAGHVIEPDRAVRESAPEVERWRIRVAGSREEVTGVAVTAAEHVEVVIPLRCGLSDHPCQAQRCEGQ